MATDFAAERETLDLHRDELLKAHLDEWVVVHERSIIGFARTLDEAFTLGFASVPAQVQFLVDQVVADDERILTAIPTLYLPNAG